MTDWERDALPVLTTVYESSKTKTASWPFVSQREVNEALGREPFDDRTDRTIRDLGNAGYLAGAGHIEQLAGPIDFELTEKSLQLLAGWPSADRSAADAFLAALRELAETAPPDERRQLEKLEASAREVGHGVLADLIAGTIRGLGGGFGVS